MRAPPAVVAYDIIPKRMVQRHLRVESDNGKFSLKFLFRKLQEPQVKPAV